MLDILWLGDGICIGMTTDLGLLDVGMRPDVYSM